MPAMPTPSLLSESESAAAGSNAPPAASCEAPSSAVVVSVRQALRLSPPGLVSLLRQHGPAIRSLEARALDLAAFTPPDTSASHDSTPSAKTTAESRLLVPASLRSLELAARLTCIDLAGSKKVAPHILASLATSQPQLKRLVLAGCSQLTDDATCNIIDRCTDLTALSLARCRLLTPVTLDALRCSGLMARLEDLDLSGLPHISAEDVLATVLSGPNPHLRRLRLAGIRGISDALLQRVAEVCPALELLDASAPDPTGTMSALAVRRATGLRNAGAAGVCAGEVTVRGLEALAESICAGRLQVLLLRGRAGLYAGAGAAAQRAAAQARFVVLRELDVRCGAAAIRMVGGSSAA